MKIGALAIVLVTQSVATAAAPVVDELGPEMIRLVRTEARRGRLAESNAEWKRRLNDAQTDRARMLPLGMLALIANEQGQYARALEHLERFSQLQARFGVPRGAIKPTVEEDGNALVMLAFLCSATGQAEKARAYFKRAHDAPAAQMKVLHYDPLIGLMSEAELAWKYLDEGKAKEGDQAFRLSLKYAERELGAAHPNFASILEGLAAALERAGKTSEAATTRGRAKQIWQRSGVTRD